MADLNDPTLNVNIANDANTKLVSVITDGSVERLAVDTNQTGGVQLEKFVPRTNISLANTVLSDVSYTTLINLTTEGKLSFLLVSSNRSDFTLRITVDGVVMYNLSQSDLGSTLGLTSSVGTTIPMYTSIANKNYHWNPIVPTDFATEFKVEAIKTIAQTTTVNWFMSYRMSV